MQSTKSKVRICFFPKTITLTNFKHISKNIFSPVRGAGEQHGPPGLKKIVFYKIMISRGHNIQLDKYTSNSMKKSNKILQF